MVLEAIFSFGIWIFEMIAEALPPMQSVVYSVSNALSHVLGFGIWVIGDDMWLIFLTSIAAWLTFKMTWGVILFIYRLLPFC